MVNWFVSQIASNEDKRSELSKTPSLPSTSFGDFYIKKISSKTIEER